MKWLNSPFYAVGAVGLLGFVQFCAMAGWIGAAHLSWGYAIPLLLLAGGLAGFAIYGVLQLSVFRAVVEKSSTHFMLASPRRVITYINPALHQIFASRENELKNHLPEFSVQSLIGTCVDVFHKKHPHLASVLSQLKNPIRGQMHIGDLNFEVLATPIQDGWGKRAIMVEWLDKTHEKLFLQKAEESIQIRQALDCADTKLMVASQAGKVVYINPAMAQLLTELNTRYGFHFDPKNMVQQALEDVYAAFRTKNMVQRTGAHDAKLHLESAGVLIEVLEKDILNDHNQPIGRVIEWINLTEDNFYNKEIDEAISRILKGDLSTLIPITHQKGLIRKISEGLNTIMQLREAVIAETGRVMAAVSNGDLTLRVQSEYEGIFETLKNHVNTSCDKLSHVMGKIRECSESIALGSEEISRGNHDLNSRTQQQASTLEQTSSSMEEMSNMVRENATQAKKAFELSQSARRFAQQGGAVTDNMVRAMDEINRSSMQIQNIIGVIDEIAFQTNLLALNAAVEAARAGEQGRGFAVVASEVRSLAQRSAASAKEIQSLISDSAQKVREGERLVNDSQLALQQIVHATEEVNHLLTGLSESSEQQAQAITQINTAISQLDAMTQQNASLVEEVSASSESMGNQVHEMEEMLNFFRYQAKPSALSAHSHIPSKARSMAVETGSTAYSALSARKSDKVAGSTGPKSPVRNTYPASPSAKKTSVPLSTGHKGLSTEEGWEEF